MTINKWQLADCDQKAWDYLLGAYLFYSLCVFVGYEIARQVGSVAVLCVLLFLIITKGFIRISNRSDKVLALLLLFSLVFSSLLNPKTFELLPFIKRIVLCLFLLLAVAYPASPIVCYRYRYLFSLAIIGISAIGLLVFGPGAEYRVTGAFVHTNVMAFVLLLSFMFLSHDDNRGLKVFVHISVVLLMLLTSSISALISYFLGMSYLVVYLSKYRGYWRRALRLMILLPVLIWALCQVPALSDRVDYVQMRLRNQSFVVLDGGRDALIDGDYDHAKYARLALSDETSGIWRLSYWSTLFQDQWQAGPKRVLLGSGPASSVLYHGYQPHGEIVRLIYEQGVIGFALSTIIVFKIFLRVHPDYKYAYIMFIPTFLFSNPMDNLYGMSLILICMNSVVVSSFGARQRGLVQLLDARMIHNNRL